MNSDRTHAFGFHYDKYGEISPPLSYTLHHTQFDFPVSDIVRENSFTYCIVDTARWANLSIRHHIKPEDEG